MITPPQHEKAAHAYFIRQKCVLELMAWPSNVNYAYNELENHLI